MGKHAPNASNGAAGSRTAAAVGLSSRYRRLWLSSVFFTAFVSLTPLVIMTFVNFYQYRKILRAEMIHPIARLTSTSKRFIDDFLEEHQAALTYVVNRESYEDLCDLEKLNEMFLNLNKSFGGFIDLGVIDSDGKPAILRRALPTGGQGLRGTGLVPRSLHSRSPRQRRLHGLPESSPLCDCRAQGLCGQARLLHSQGHDRLGGAQPLLRLARSQAVERRLPDQPGGHRCRPSRDTTGAFWSPARSRRHP